MLLIFDQKILSTPLFTFCFYGAITIRHVLNAIECELRYLCELRYSSIMNDRHSRVVVGGCTDGV